MVNKYESKTISEVRDFLTPLLRSQLCNSLLLPPVVDSGPAKRVDDSAALPLQVDKYYRGRRVTPQVLI
jgi:hypothetical protein